MSLNVTAGTTAAFSLSTIPETAGVAFSQSISSTDQWGNPTSSYAGTKCLVFSGPSSSPAPTLKAPAYPALGTCAYRAVLGHLHCRHWNTLHHVV